MKNKSSARKSIRLALWLILVTALAAAVSGVFAKYSQTETKVDDTLSSAFYFTSPLLSEAKTTYTLAPDTTQLKIPLCNYADNLRFSTAEIQYSYTVTKDNQEIVNGHGVIAAGSAQTADISLTGLTTGTYTVTAQANAPFACTLSGEFIISKESSDLHFNVADSSGSPFVLLTIWTENDSGNIKVTWPAGLIPDSTDSLLSGVKTYSTGGSYAAGTVTVSCGAYGSHVYRFFKQDPSQVYNDNHFTVAKSAQ